MRNVRVLGSGRGIGALCSLLSVVTNHFSPQTTERAVGQGAGAAPRREEEAAYDRLLSSAAASRLCRCAGWDLSSCSKKAIRLISFAGAGESPIPSCAGRPTGRPAWWLREPNELSCSGCSKWERRAIAKCFPPVGSACCFKIKLVLVSKQEQDDKIKFSEECCESCVKNKPQNVFPSRALQRAFAPLCLPSLSPFPCGHADHPVDVKASVPVPRSCD